jgi:eukaryotic-like serine/threonine-protein kinase
MSRMIEAAGKHDVARAAIAQARVCLLDWAAKISDEELRTSFLGNVCENARTLALAREWLGT